MPVRPAPCVVAPFPPPPTVIHLERCDGLTCLQPPAAAALGAWTRAVKAWRDSVLACPAVKVVIPPKDPPVVHAQVPSVSEVMSYDPQDSLR